MIPLDHDAAVRKVMGMRISDHGLQFIIGWEGSRNQLYDDGGKGYGNCTIGVGHLVHIGPCDGGAEEQPFLTGITDQQVADLLRSDVLRYSDAVSRLTPNLNQNQYDALVDFAFNCGVGAVEQLAATVKTGGDPAPIMRRFIHDGSGKVLDALVRRRDAEIQLFNTPEEGRMYTDAQIDAMLAERDDKIGKLYAALLDHASWLSKLYNAVIDHAKRLAALEGK